MILKHSDEVRQKINPTTVLIVDDDRDLLEATQDMIELEDNYTVVTAHDSFSAITQAEKHRPDIALIDIKLGHTNGLDLVPMLKNSMSNVFCVMMTAFRDVEYAVRAVRAGADDYLYKPFKPEQLLNTLDHYRSLQMLNAEKRQSENLFKAVFEQSFQLLFMLSPDATIAELNETAVQFSGQKKSSLVGKNIWYSGIWGDSLQTALILRKLSEQVVKGYFVKDEITTKSRSGDDLYFEVCMKPVLDAYDVTTNVIVECHDITDRKGAEKVLRNENDSLGQRVVERTRELEAAKIRAEKASHAKSEFLSHMSHELRTPLNPIIGFAELLISSDADNLTEEQKSSLGEISKAGRSMLDMINEMLSLSTLETGKLEINIKDVNLQEVINDSLSMIRPMLANKNIKMNNEISNVGEVFLLADPVCLMQVLTNLLSNAAKHNNHNGQIELGLEDLGNNYMRIYITDDGKGIAEDKFDSLFEPFNQLGDEFISEGVGIGLTITKKLVEMMGGSIGFQSQEGVGTTFWVDLARA